MRQTISLDKNWLYHEGDINYSDFNDGMPPYKGIVYAEAKTTRAIFGPASRYHNVRYNDFGPDPHEMREATYERWEEVSLPHDYIIKQAPNEKNNSALGFFNYPNAWYRRHFISDKENQGKRHLLSFDGASHCDVYLNGCIVYRNRDGYTPFEVDITDYVDFENPENVIAVYIYGGAREGWWYEGAGIYRHVTLIITELVGVDRYGVYVKPVREGDFWHTYIETTVVNELADATSVKAVTEIIDPNGNIVGAAEAVCTVSLYEKTTLKYSLDIFSPMLWDTEHPNLYNAKTSIYANEGLADIYTTRFGFREFLLDKDKGLFLNGRHVKIKGVCSHSDFGLTGKAVSDNIQRHKIKLIREMGANGYRTSHYPHDTATMDALDENGFIVMDEVRFFESSEFSLAALETIVKRDRNRPSVLFWSLGNEEMYFVKDEGRRIIRRMNALVKKLDDIRPTTFAYADRPGNISIFDEVDVIGINYGYHVFDEIRKKYPDKAFVSSENCAVGTTRGHYLPHSDSKAMRHAYDEDISNWQKSREMTWNFINDREYVTGGYQWIAFEHRGEAEWPRVCSISGAIDLFLQKKDAFYQNLSYWSDIPMVHLMPHWNFEGLEGENIRVRIYTNCERVEVLLNGKIIAQSNVKKYTHFDIDVPYEAGRLETNAYNGSVLCAHDERITSGKAVALKLKLENELTDDLDDVALFTCYCVDENNVEVPTSTPFVTFFADEECEIIGTGSSNTDHVPVTSNERQMYAGRISVAVKRNSGKKLKLYAQSDGLKSAVFSCQ